VIQVVDSLAIGGAERMAVDISNELAARGWVVHLVATRALGPLTTEVDNRVELHCLLRSSRWDLNGLWRFRQLVSKSRPAAVHVHGWSSLQFSTAGLIGSRVAPALIFHDHRGVGLGPPPKSYRLAAWPLTVAHVAVDRALLDRPLRTRRASINSIIPNGTPLNRFTRKPSYLLGSPPRLVALANFRREKNHLLLLDALARLASWGVPTETDLIGATPDAGYEAECRARIWDLGLGETVTIVGARQDTGTLLASYDIGVLSSSTESGPIALIEYLAAGLPFVVTDVGEIPARLPGNLRRWMVPPRDDEALASKLREALALSAHERSAAAAVGVAFAHEHLSIDRTVDAIESLYQRVSRR
jgi:glycosyltransferase involved in cell wall biosynthesis